MTTSRVLVVEDDPTVARLLGTVLPKHGLEAMVVGSAEEALEAMAAHTVDLVLVDKNLPAMSGMELVEKIRVRLPDVDVILMTAFADVESVLAALRAGVYDYLLKPFNSIDEVIQKVQRALEKRHMYLENLRLVEDLTILNARVEQMNRDLEEQVEERTQQLKEANQRLRDLSLTDDVTGLYNQRYLYQRLEHEFRREARYHEGLSIIMIDIDNFKLVNDTHDHIFGSRVLNRVGQVLLKQVRTVDSCVRYGGDEFVILLPHTSLEEAMRVAERIRRAIEQTDLGDHSAPYRVTVSVGVATPSQGTVDSKELLRCADRALYAAKEQGRNRVVGVGDSGVGDNDVAGTAG